MTVLRPNIVLSLVTQVDANLLRDMRVEGLVIDIDNTIVPWRGETPDNDIIAWLDTLKEAGILMVLVSNAGGERADRMSRLLDIPAVAPAKKPFRSGYNKAMALLGLKPDSVAAVGDQIFTDVYGANKAGLKSILVDPISAREFAGTRLVRLMERRFRSI